MYDLRSSPRINNRSFDLISNYVNEHFGINLTKARLSMIENRLMKRVKHLNLFDFKEYTK